MENLDQKVLQASSGEHRFDPDQQRRFLGTFEERVILAITLEDARLEVVRNQLADILNQIIKIHENPHVKLSSNLPNSLQMNYMKLANQINLNVTVIREDKSLSPYGVIIHSDKPVDIINPDIRSQFPNLFEEPKTSSSEQTEKKSLWKKIFG
jgi:uncharacterized protein YueI